MPLTREAAVLPCGHVVIQRSRVAEAADVGLLVVYGAVGFFFLVRFAHLRKAPSLLLAVTIPLGWLLVAMWDLDILQPMPSAPIRWIGVIFGILLLQSVVTWRREADEPKPRDL